MHSSLEELQAFVAYVAPRKLLPLVGRVDEWRERMRYFSGLLAPPRLDGGPQDLQRAPPTPGVVTPVFTQDGIPTRPHPGRNWFYRASRGRGRPAQPAAGLGVPLRPPAPAAAAARVPPPVTVPAPARPALAAPAALRAVALNGLVDAVSDRSSKAQLERLLRTLSGEAAPAPAPADEKALATAPTGRVEVIELDSGDSLQSDDTEVDAAPSVPAPTAPAAEAPTTLESTLSPPGSAPAAGPSASPAPASAPAPAPASPASLGCTASPPRPSPPLPAASPPRVPSGASTRPRARPPPPPPPSLDGTPPASPVKRARVNLSLPTLSWISALELP